MYIYTSTSTRWCPLSRDQVDGRHGPGSDSDGDQVISRSQCQFLSGESEPAMCHVTPSRHVLWGITFWVAELASLRGLPLPFHSSLSATWSRLDWRGGCRYDRDRLGKEGIDRDFGENEWLFTAKFVFVPKLWTDEFLHHVSPLCRHACGFRHQIVGILPSSVLNGRTSPSLWSRLDWHGCNLDWWI